MNSNRLSWQSGRSLAATMLLASVWHGGCASAPGEIFPEPEQPLVWPAPPEEPRIQYVGQLVSDTDLNRSRSLGDAIGETLFGEQDALSMLMPQGVCTDTRGRVLVADGSGQMVHVFDLESRRYERWTPPSEDAVFAQPVAVTTGPNDEVYVSDPVGGAVHVFDTGGRWLEVIGEDSLERPAGIAVDAAGSRLFVVDTAAHMVRVFDLNGELLQSIGGRGIGLGQFNYPTHVATDGQGRLYVSDSLNFRVQIFDPTLTPLRAFGSQGDMPGYFAQPKGIAVDSDGNIYVVDAQFEAVQVFDEMGRLLISFGYEGTDPGQFWLPNGIYIDSTDRIWVADTYNRRIQVFRYLKGSSP